MKRFPLFIAIFLSLLLLSGCGYFNTFYNAKKQFGEAERDTRAQQRQARRQQQQQPQQPNNPNAPPQQGGSVPPGAGGAPGQSGVASEKYRKVIETSARLLEEHPKSRWADDALFLMGVSYYRLGDLPRAERKFTELMTLFPNSKLVSEATLWKARTLAAEKKKDDAIQLLQTGLELLKPGPEKASALLLMGSLCYDAKRYSDASGYFEQAAGMRQPNIDRINALNSYGQAEFDLGHFEKARDAFAEVASSTGDVQQGYDASIRCSQCEVELKHFDRAQLIIEKLKSGERFLDYSEDIPLELAQLAVRTGRVDEGIRLYQEFIDQHTNGERRGLAFYRLALIHRDQRVDLTLAKALLDSAMRVGPSRQIGDSARAAMEQISKGLLALDKIKALQTEIADLQTQADSISIPRDALTPSALLAFEDSVRRRESALKPAVVKAPPAPVQQAAAPDTAHPALPPVAAATDTARHSPASPKLPHAVKDSTRKPAGPAVVHTLPPVAKTVSPPPLVKAVPTPLDSNETWELARRAFRAMILEERFGLQTLTRAIETRDSSRTEGNNDHVLRMQGVINRAYGVGTRNLPAVADSLKGNASPKKATRVAVAPSALDSVEKVNAAASGRMARSDSAAAPVRTDTLARPSSPDTTRPADERHSLRGFRSTADSQGGAPPDSTQKPPAQDSIPVGGSRPPLPPLPSPTRPAPADSTFGGTRPQHFVPLSASDSTDRRPLPVDSARPDTIPHPVGSSVRPTHTDSTAAASVRATPAQTLRTQLLAKERELQLAYLHAAEFYAYSLTEQDSALNYYRLAATSPVNAEVFWRSNLFLGSALTPKADSTARDSLTGEAADHYRYVVAADSVPSAAANAARAALKLPLIEVPVPAQVAALHAAENAQFTPHAPVDSVLALYSHVIAFDSTSREGKKALFAKATLLEKDLRRYDQARVVYQHLLALNPDSAMEVISKAKVAPPDSNSIFNMSDAELFGKREPVEALFDQKQDESGWPPSEETLRGRHFR
ncbi:MAG TPA: tetratricopeptide repeat protein [bacterium]|jgi:tetratricopeptide (TPR) repeat protein